MNKTIIINISGIIFHIEEDAYEQLKQYMSEVKQYFTKSEDSFEIISDIENRVAELFSEIIKAEEKEVIVNADVEKVVRTMGKPSDFEKEIVDDELNIDPKIHIKKRLYRNPDDKIAGGVCSGIAAYLNIDPIWIRLLLIISVFFFGTGILLYIILWIIMPEAKTRTEKLAMRGESPTLESIRRSVEEEINGMRRNFDRNGVNGSSALRVLIDNLSNAIGQIFKFLSKVLYKALGAGIVAATMSFIIISSIALLTILGVVSSDFNTELPLFMLREDNQELLLIAAFLVVVVPLLSILLLGLRILINVNPFNRISGLTLLGVWLVALMLSVYYSVDTIKNFQEEGNLQESRILNQSSVDKLYLITEYDESINFDTLKTKEYKIKDRVVIKSKGLESAFNNIDLSIVKSDNDQFRLVTNYISRGPSEKQAIEYAENIEYTVRQQDSVLIFPEFFKLKKQTLWRTQEVRMTLYVPLDKKVVIHEDVDKFTRNIYSYACLKDSKDRTYWSMAADGLECIKDTTKVQD